jgi:hypothetical protein
MKRSEIGHGMRIRLKSYAGDAEIPNYQCRLGTVSGVPYRTGKSQFKVTVIFDDNTTGAISISRLLPIDDVIS